MIQAAGVTDSAFHRANWHRAPVTAILATVKALVRKQAFDAAVAAVPIARAVMAFAGKDCKLTESDFYPLPLDGEPTQGEQLHKRTALALQRLLRAKKIPGKVTNALESLWPTYKRLIS